MAADPLHALLLGDAVDQLKLDPAASQRWHALLDVRNAAPDGELDARLIDTLRSGLPDAGVAGFLRADFLAAISGDPAWSAEAGRILLTIEPFDTERVMAFATYQWARNISGAGDHAGFRAALRGASLPALMALAGSALLAAVAADGVAAKVIAAHRNAADSKAADSDAADSNAAASKAADSLAEDGLAQATRAAGALRKVVVVAPFLGADSHPPTEMALRQASLLRELGVDVRLASCQELVQPRMPDYLGGRGSIHVDGAALANLQARLPAGATLALSDARLSLMLRWRTMVAEIARFDPDLVMFVGLQSPLMSALHAAWPVLGLNVHAFAPLAPVDVWLCADAALAGRDDSAWGPSMGRAHAHYHPFRLPAPAPVAQPFTRAELGVRAGQVVIVSVGHRLAHEIDGAWAARMLAVMARHPDAIWLLAGGPGLLPPALAGADPARLRLVGHSARLRSVYQCGDVYANPARVGGGFSAAEAMAAGLPVLALAGGDAGSKLGGDALADDDAYFARLDALLASAPARAQLGARLRERFATTLDLAASHDSLRAACALAQARFQARTASP